MKYAKYILFCAFLKLFSYSRAQSYKKISIFALDFSLNLSEK